MVADELRRQADHFIDLLDLAEFIEREGVDNEDEDADDAGVQATVQAKARA
jgi:uncharacterized LabA/DUF88 family protein